MLSLCFLKRSNRLFNITGNIVIQRYSTIISTNKPNLSQRKRKSCNEREFLENGSNDILNWSVLLQERIKIFERTGIKDWNDWSKLMDDNGDPIVQDNNCKTEFELIFEYLRSKDLQIAFQFFCQADWTKLGKNCMWTSARKLIIDLVSSDFNDEKEFICQQLLQRIIPDKYAILNEHVHDIILVLRRQSKLIGFWFHELFEKQSIETVCPDYHQKLLNYFLRHFRYCKMYDFYERAFSMRQKTNEFAYEIAIRVECEKLTHDIKEKGANISLENIESIINRYKLRFGELPNPLIYCKIIKLFSNCPGNEHDVDLFLKFFQELPSSYKTDYNIAKFVFYLGGIWKKDRRIHEFIFEYICTLKFNKKYALEYIVHIANLNNQKCTRVFLEHMEALHLQVDINILNMILQSSLSNHSFGNSFELFQSLLSKYKLTPNGRTIEILSEHFVENIKHNYIASEGVTDALGELKRAELQVCRIHPLTTEALKFFVDAYLNISNRTEALRLLKEYTPLVDSSILVTFAEYYCNKKDADQLLQIMKHFEAIYGIVPSEDIEGYLIKAYLNNNQFQEADVYLRNLMSREVTTNVLLSRLTLLRFAVATFKAAEQTEKELEWKRYLQRFSDQHRNSIIGLRKSTPKKITLV